MSESLKGLKSVSRTGPECPLNNGIRSGSFPLSERGITANAPPPGHKQMTFIWDVRTSGFPVDGNIKRVNFYQIAIPS